MEKKERNKNLDLIKIIACFMVVCLHSVIDGLNTKNLNVGLIFYYFGVFAIPLFFMVNGFLQLKKETIRYKYCLKKILKIITITFILNIFVVIFKYLIKHDLNNIFINTFECLFLQKGMLDHLWFLGTICLIYITLPLLNKFCNKGNNIFFLTIILIILCWIIDSINIRNNFIGEEIIRKTIKQPFRLWTWFTYFCIGGCISKHSIINIKLNKLLIPFFFFSIIIISLGIKYLYGDMYAENAYDNIFVMITSILIFIYINNMNLNSNTINKIINIFSPLVMGIYIFHPFIVRIIRKIIGGQNNFINFGIAIVSFVLCGGISYIINKIPKVNNIIKL